MTVKSIPLATVAAIAAIALAEPATAIPACKDGVTATGRVAARNAAKLAEKRAVSAWSAEVRTRCGTHSPYWWRALGKKVACKSVVAGTTCTVSAVPAKKLLKSVR